MTAGLLERDAELRRLRESLRGAGQGRGSVVLVSGEAGIGKTSLVRAFAREAAGRARVLAGACDDLVTPRTLGPFRDMARGAAPALAAAIEPGAGAGRGVRGRPPGAGRPADGDAGRGRPLGRRRHPGRAPLPGLADPRAARVCWCSPTARTSWAAEHPLRRVLAALPHQEVRRLHLRPLSAGAVEELAGAHGADAAAVLGGHRRQPVLRHRGAGQPRGRGAGHRPGRRPGPAGGPRANPPGGPWSCWPPCPARPSGGWSRSCSATR